ncbi:amidohydrolase family protein [Rhizorhabdus dicambivorans]|nr:amidohydrolase family protein [Rhizorhabdus dicambivorans]
MADAGIAHRLADAARAAPAGKLILTNANIVDVVGEHSGLGTVVISGDRIASVVHDIVKDAAADVQLVDLGGLSLMAGMFNCHFHATYPGLPLAAKRLPIGLEQPPVLQTLQAAYTVQKAMASGFTSLVSAGAPFAIDAGLKAAIAQGLLSGPRIMAGSRDISTTGHSLDQLYPWYWDGVTMPSVVNCDGEDAFRRAVREEIKRGAEIIKVFATSGHGVPGNLGQIDLTRAEFAAITSAAHQRGAKVRAHVANLEGIELALDVGVDLIDHGDGLDRRCMERMIGQGVFLAPSMLYAHRYVQQMGGVLADAMKADLDRMGALLPEANAAGLQIVLGDDYGGALLAHGDYGAELDYYVNIVGINARDVLRWATLHGAQLVGRGDDLGRLSGGSIADLLIIDGDPVADIRVLLDPLNILAVIQDGKFVSFGRQTSAAH